MACCCIIIGVLTDGPPLQNIGARAPGLMYTVCRNGAQTRQTGFTTSERQQSPDWIGLCSVLRPCQHSIGYMGDGFYRSKDPTNSIKVLKEMLQRKKQKTKTTKSHIDIQ